MAGWSHWALRQGKGTHQQWIAEDDVVLLVRFPLPAYPHEAGTAPPGQAERPVRRAPGTVVVRGRRQVADGGIGEAEVPPPPDRHAVACRIAQELEELQHGASVGQPTSHRQLLDATL